MATRLGSNDPIRIGEILRKARERQGIGIEEVEDRTKIRVKYLRALEEENWDVLPGSTYTRGFIRTYGGLLGLDAEILVDEFRRRSEEAPVTTYELAGPVLREPPLNDARRRPIARRLILAAVAVEIVAVLVVVWLVVGGGDDERGKRKGDKGQRKERKDERPAAAGTPDRDDSAGGSKTVTVRLVARSDLQACVVDDNGRVLVPNQVITAGAQDGPYTSKRFRLELDPATARIFVNGKKAAASPSAEPAAYRVTPAGVRQATFTGGLCP